MALYKPLLGGFVDISSNDFRPLNISLSIVANCLTKHGNVLYAEDSLYAREYESGFYQGDNHTGGCGESNELFVGALIRQIN